MNLKGILRAVWSGFSKFLDTDKDGRIEISDLPGAMAKAAAMRAEGQALFEAGEAVVGALIDAATDGDVTVNGAPVTADELRAAFARAKALPPEAGDIARAELAKG